MQVLLFWSAVVYIPAYVVFSAIESVLRKRKEMLFNLKVLAAGYLLTCAFILLFLQVLFINRYPCFKEDIKGNKQYTEEQCPNLYKNLLNSTTMDKVVVYSTIKNTLAGIAIVIIVCAPYLIATKIFSQKK